jgi:hypothetical protein
MGFPLSQGVSNQFFGFLISSLRKENASLLEQKLQKATSRWPKNWPNPPPATGGRTGYQGAVETK